LYTIILWISCSCRTCGCCWWIEIDYKNELNELNKTAVHSHVSPKHLRCLDHIRILKYVNHVSMIDRKPGIVTCPLHISYIYHSLHCGSGFCLLLYSCVLVFFFCLSVLKARLHFQVPSKTAYPHFPNVIDNIYLPCTKVFTK
jgi:hypothetical protein